MLDYRKYRNNFVENTPEPEVPEEQPESINSTIDQAIDSWIKSLKMALVTQSPAKRGLWDRFKNTVANVWHGREGEANPYKYVNKFGDQLGQPEKSESVLLHLSDYTELRTICESLEQLINEDENALAGTENLRLMQIIDQKAKQLKDALKNIVNRQNPSPSNVQSEPVATAAIPTSGNNHSMAVNADSNATMDTNDVPPIRGVGDDEALKAAQDKKYAIEPEKKQHVPWEHLEDDKKYVTPPTHGKPWDKLGEENQLRWNAYGGGTNYPHNHKDYPILFRIGDPRIHTLNKYDLTKLRREGRIEELDNPIKSKLDFDDRIHETKRKMAEEAQRRVAARKAKDSKEIEKTGMFPDFKSDGADVSSNNDTVQKPPLTNDYKIGANLGTKEEPNNINPVTDNPDYKVMANLGPKHTPHNNLAPTAHQPDEKSGEEEKLPQETQPNDSDSDSSEDPLANDKKLSREKLTDYVGEKIKDRSIRDDLFTKIAGLKKKSELVKMRDEIWQAVEDADEATIQKLIQNGAGDRKTALQWLSSGRTETVRDLYNISKLKLERKKISDLSFEGKINYFKELLKNN